MATTLYGIPNCDTIRKARGWLAANGVGYAFHDYRSDGVDPARLRRWVAAIGWETLLNRSGTTFRKISEADRLGIDADKAITLMLANPSAIRRPVLERDDGVPIVGFSPDRYAAAFA